MTYDPNNIFARILRGELPMHKVFEDEKTLSFMDIMPQAEGHTLVVPKCPAADLFALPAEFAGPLLETTMRVAMAVKKATGAPGIMIAQLNGREAGQTVFHLHCHIIPRWHGADLAMHAHKMEAPEKLAAMAEKIRAALG